MDFKEQLKSSVDIVQVVSEYLPLRKAGPMRYVGLCPFHSEKTPSFSVHAGHQFYKCFGCNAGGDVIKFVMEIDRLSFYEALKLLAERHGIPMPKRTEYADPETRLRAAIYQMHELAVELFHSQLNAPAGTETRAYLERRGVSPAIAEQFGIGYADRSGRTLLRLLEQHHFSAEQLEASGLVMRRPDGSFYDRFRHRLMFPIHSESGKVIAFGGRALAPDDEPKYLNSSETPIYTKSHVLYNLHRAKQGIRKADRVILVEGYMDAIGLTANGIAEVVAPCGTALTASQVQAMKRHSTKIVVNFDPDPAGANAAERAITLLLDEGMHVRILELDTELDPDEYCKERGVEAYQACLNKAKGYFYWLADRARARFDMRTAEGRVAAFQFLLPSIQRLGDKIERMAVANDVAAYLGVEAGLVLENFRKAALERRRHQAPAGPDPVAPAERILLLLLLANTEARQRFLPALKPLPVIERFRTLRIFQVLFALYESGAAITFDEVYARLEKDDQDLLASVVFTGETEESALSLEQGEACLRSLQAASRKAQVAEWKSRIKAAERAGNLAEALELAAELRRLEEELKRLDQY
jgi:DNA primase